MRKLTLFLFVLFSFSAYPHVELIYPEGGELFKAGDTITIRWLEEQTHVTLNLELYFTPDGGVSWEEISTSIGVADRAYDWIIPPAETTRGRIRVVQNNEEENYDDMCSNFKIEIVNSVAEIASSQISFATYPNPTIQNLNLNIQAKQAQNIVLELIDLRGKLVMVFDPLWVSTGTTSINLNISEVKAGNYLLILKSEGVICKQKLVISR